MRTSSCQRGFSVAELLVVLAIIGILSLVAVPQFISMYHSSTTKSSMRDFTSTLRKARQLAVTRGERTRVTFSTGTTGGATFKIDTGGTNLSAPTWVLFPGSSHALEPTMYFDASSTLPATSGTNLEVDFLPSGLACEPDDSSSTTDPPKALGTTSSSNNTVVLRSYFQNLAFNQYTITINTTGGVSATGSKWQ